MYRNQQSKLIPQPHPLTMQSTARLSFLVLSIKLRESDSRPISRLSVRDGEHPEVFEYVRNVLDYPPRYSPDCVR